MNFIFLPYILLPIFIFYSCQKRMIQSLGWGNFFGIVALLIYSFFLGIVDEFFYPRPESLEPQCGLGDPSIMLPLCGILFLTPISFIFSMILAGIQKYILKK